MSAADAMAVLVDAVLASPEPFPVDDLDRLHTAIMGEACHDEARLRRLHEALAAAQTVHRPALRLVKEAA